MWKFLGGDFGDVRENMLALASRYRVQGSGKKRLSQLLGFD